MSDAPNAIEPKTEFIQTLAATEYAELAQNPAFKVAVRTALLQFIQDQPVHQDFNTATKAQYELQGAKRLVSILINLSKPEQSTKPLPTGVLQWPQKPSRRQPQQPQMPNPQQPQR